jgi:hypothetical protein
VEIGQDGVLHVLAGHVTLHLDRDMCEELTTTLARAVIKLAKSDPRQRRRELRLVPAVTPAKVAPDRARTSEPAGPGLPALDR